jgi:L-amino acid N-acyltransferase YncA
MAASLSGVRPASAQDAAACLAIYRPYVQTTAISWEIDVPTVADMAARIDGLRATHEWLVLERDDQSIGFACGQPLKRLATFQWSAETGIYVDVDHHRAGGGRELYTQLLRRLTERGCNPTSPATHFIDPSGSGTLAHTVAWHGCNSIWLRPAVQMGRPARFADPRSAGDRAVKKPSRRYVSQDWFCQGEPWTRRPPAVHLHP